MFQTISTRSLTIILSTLIMLGACRKREADLPNNLASFQATSQGLGPTENSLDVKIELDRGTDRDIPITINFTPDGLTYGTDFTTTPAAVNNVITVTIPSGNNEAHFIVSKVPGALFDGDEKIVFDIYSSAAPVLIGVEKQFTLSFAELVAANATATIDGGGPTYPNKVFLDLSANRQTPVLRSNWDMGFYTAEGSDFRVILNSSTAMMAKQIGKNDLTQVSAADTVGFYNEVAFSQTDPVTTSLPYIDHPSGDLTRTAIAAVEQIAEDNKVYIVNRGYGVGLPAPARGWKKIRIVRNGTGYTLQYADIAATSFQEINITRDDAYFFKYISFENGAVNVEPAKTKWDLAWTYFSNVTNFGAGEVPYLFQDIIVKNRNVEVAKVLTATKSYESFGEADLAGLTWLTSQTAIGSDWRSGGGPTSSPAVRTDRYYIVRDGDNNYYKLRFTALTQNGERGYPAYEVVLVKAG